jgi:hypothetical protein
MEKLSGLFDSKVRINTSPGFVIGAQQALLAQRHEIENVPTLNG